MTVVLDAWAAIALLQDEAPAARIETALQEGAVVICAVNLGEAYYSLIRRVGEATARRNVESIRVRARVEPADWPLTVTASRIKARGGLSYPDAFCIATAQRHRAPLWTGDDEILALAGEAEMVDLRS